MIIPALEPHCGSWVVRNKQTGRGIVEVFSRLEIEDIAQRLNPEQYEILTTAQYLGQLNQSVKEE